MYYWCFNLIFIFFKTICLQDFILYAHLAAKVHQNLFEINPVSMRASETSSFTNFLSYPYSFGKIQPESH